MSQSPEDVHVVVVNGEGQYALWPQGKPMPQGWQAAGFSGSTDECIAYVDRAWADMTPRSLRPGPSRPS